MVWFNVDDGLWSHPKFVNLPDSAQALWLRAGTWSAKHLTDGYVPQHILTTLGYRTRTVGYLVKAGLWEESDDGYRFHDWAKYNRTRDQVEADRTAAAERKRNERERKQKRDESRRDRNPEWPESGGEVVGVWSESGQSLAKVWPRNGETIPANKPIGGDSHGVSHSSQSTPLPSIPINSPSGELREARERASVMNPTTQVGAAFAQVYAVWPRAVAGHESRGKAVDAFLAMIKHPDFKDDLAGAVRAVKSYAQAYMAAGESPAKCRGFERWVNDEAWSDPSPQPVQRAGHRQKAEEKSQDTRDIIAMGKRLQIEYDERQQQGQQAIDVGQFGRNV